MGLEINRVKHNHKWKNTLDWTSSNIDAPSDIMKSRSTGGVDGTRGNTFKYNFS